MKTKKFLLATVLVLAAALLVATQALAITADEILRRVDENNKIKTAYMEVSLIIQSGNRQMTKTMKIWSEGEEKALVIFTNPGDRGTKYLKLGKEMWIYSPEAEEVVKISGHMLRQGMAGSDFSYEDALESEQLRDRYDVKLVGEEEKNGRECYVLELTLKPGQEASYYRRKVWVSKAEFVGVHEELYAQSGKPLKVFTVSKVEKFGSRYFATEAVMENLLKKNSSTRMVINKMEFDVNIPPGTFSLQQITKK